MHHLNHKLSSFTLIEMLVVLVLSSIIVSSIYFAFYTVTKYQMDLTTRYSDQNDKSTVYFLLKKDFDRSDKVNSIDKFNLHCHIPKRGIDVYYNFTSDYIVRQQDERLDTFRCQVVDKPVFRWQGKDIDLPNSLMDELKLEITGTSHANTLTVYKQYDAASLIQISKIDTLQ